MNAYQSLKRFLNRESVKRILKSLQYLGLERIIKIFVGVFVHSWIARYLGPERFGRLSYILNFTSIFLPFVTFGVEDVLAKHFFKNDLEAKNIVSSQIYLRFITALIGFCLLSFFVFINDEFEINYKLMIICYGSTLFFRVFDVLEILHQSALDLRPVFWARNISYLSSSIFKLFGMFWKMNISFFLATYFWEVFSWKGLNYVNFIRNNNFTTISKKHVYSYLKESFPIFLGAFVVMLDLKLGNIVLKEFWGDAEVGNFSVVMILLELWNFIPSAVCISLYPAMFNAKEGRSGNYQLRVQYLYDFLFWLGFGFAASVTFFSPMIVNVLYSNRFPGLSPLLALASWIAIMNFLSFGRIKFFTLEGSLKEWVTYTFTSLVFNIGIQIMIVPDYGSKGVFVSMLISPYLSLVVCSLISVTLRKEAMIIINSLRAPFRWIKLVL